MARKPSIVRRFPRYTPLRMSEKERLQWLRHSGMPSGAANVLAKHQPARPWVLEQERQFQAQTRTARALDRIDPLKTGRRRCRCRPQRSSVFPIRALEGERSFARPVGIESRSARGRKGLESAFNAYGLPNEIQQLILASLTPQNLAKVGSNGLQARAYNPYSINANIWKAAKELPQFSPQCIRKLDAIYKAAPGVFKSPEARRIEIFNILTKCIVPFEYGTGTQSNNHYGFGIMSRMLRDMPVHALFAKLNVPENRVGKFYQDMRAVRDLAYLYSAKSPHTPKRREVQEIVKRHYNGPRVLPVRRREA